MTPTGSSKGKRLTGKLYEPFDRADGGRVVKLNLFRLYSDEVAVMAMERRGEANSQRGFCQLA
jgi:hypothetical protein